MIDESVVLKYTAMLLYISLAITLLVTYCILLRSNLLLLVLLETRKRNILLGNSNLVFLTVYYNIGYTILTLF